MLYNFFDRNKLFSVYLPLVLYWIVLFVATTLPAKQIPKTGINDKLEHLLGYFLLTFLLSNALFFQSKYKIGKRAPVSFALLIAASYGVVDELHQLIIPGRSCDLFDWMADIAGGLAAAGFYFIIKEYYFKQKVRVVN